MLIMPGKTWLDTDGHPIQAHSGGMLIENGLFYWYGGNKGAPTIPDPMWKIRVELVGVSCYVSRDLVTWRNAGLVLPARPDDLAHDLHPRNTLERPKVLKCPATGRYVMWMNMDNHTRDKIGVGVAVADHPEGPFEYLRSFRPHGCDSRDMTVFQDQDDSAWLVYASERNNTLHVGRLSDDYLDLAGDYTRILIGRRREAPTLFRYRDRLYLMTSGCTGWNPNPSEMAVAERITGPWTDLGDPFSGDAEGTSFRSQSTWAIPMPGGADGRFIYMGDRWNLQDLGASTYIWLPMSVHGGRVTIEWRNGWNPEAERDPAMTAPG